MEMSDREIALSYRTAKDPDKQIGILADRNTTSEPKMRAYLRALGLPVEDKAIRRMPKYGRFDPEKALTMYKGGSSDNEIAMVCDVDRTTVSSWRKRNGLPVNRERKKNMKKRSCRRSDEEKAIHERACKIRRMTDEQICDHFDLRTGTPENKPLSEQQEAVDRFLQSLTVRSESGERVSDRTIRKLRAIAAEKGFLPVEAV